MSADSAESLRWWRKSCQKLCCRFSSAILAGLLAAPVLLADGTQTGVIIGVVHDAEGNPLPGVEVQVQGTQVRRKVLSDGRGAFRFPALSVGRYRVTAELLGLSASADEVQVFIGNTTEVKLQLGEDGGTPAPTIEQDEWIQVVAQAPLTDKYDPRVGAEITLEFLNELPVERFYQSVALVLPGVSGGEDGNPQTSGSLRSNNLFLIDGVDTSDPTTGLFGLNLTYEAVQAVDVTTAGSSSEYGRASGAVINVVTRSGGDDYEGLVRFLGTNNDWNDDYDYPIEQVFHLEPELEAANFGPDEVDQVFTVSLGGPIREERLWFFAAYEDSEDTFLAPTRDGFLWNRGVDLQNASLKLTVRPAADHSVVLQAATDSAELTAFTPFSRGPAENRATSIPTPLSFTIVDSVPGDTFALQSQSQDGEFLKLQWDAALSQTVALSLTAAQQERQLDRERLNSRGVTADAPHVGVTLFEIDDPDNPRFEEVVLYNGITDRGFEERPRDQGNLSLDWFLGAGRVDHELSFGLDYQETESVRLFNFAGRPGRDRALDFPVDGQLFIDLDLRPPCTMAGQCLPFDPGTGEFQPFLLFNFWSREPRLTREESFAFYAADTLAVGNLVLAFGLRYETLEGEADIGRRLVDDEQLAPRASLTYDSRGDGTVLFTVGYGRFVEPFLQQYLDTFGRADILSGFTEYHWVFEERFCREEGDPSDLASPCWQPQGATPLLPVQAAAPNVELERTTVDELVVGFERQLTPQTGVSLFYIQREWNDLWDNVLGAEFPPDQGPRLFSEILNLEEAEREYRGIQLLFQKRYADNWQLLGSYTWSETEGNLFQNDGLSDFADYRDLTDLNVINRFGLAPYDREHRLRLYANYQIPLRRHLLSLGSVVRWESGVPYQAEQLSEFGRRFINPRGTLRLDELLQWDLSVGLDFRVGSGVEVELKGEVFNLTNEAQFTGVETIVDTGLFGLPGTILDLQQPRNYRLTLGVRF